MTETRVSVRERVRVIADIEGLAHYANAIATWLGEAGLEVESDAVNDASKSLLAACWFLDRPLRMHLPPQRWPQPAQQDGQQ
jgi:hypothetical protein